MTQVWVVDASVAVKWFVGEAQSELAEQLLAADIRHVAPDLIVIEVANALRRKLLAKELTNEQARHALQVLRDLFAEVMESSDLVEAAFDIAISVNHPVADCIYVALAERLDARVVTADIKMIERLAGSPYAARIVSLAEFNTGVVANLSVAASGPDAE